jgi:hypothetical protein
MDKPRAVSRLETKLAKKAAHDATGVPVKAIGRGKHPIATRPRTFKKTPAKRKAT